VTGSTSLHGWVRTRALPRVIARLCLAALILNLFAPIAWATLLPPADPVAAPCAEPADRGAHHPASQSDPADLAAHCPLCVLFGGTLWAPPVSIAALPHVAAAREPVALQATDTAPALPRTLRPTPRGPPAAL
jgi:hypothetical protein